MIEKTLERIVERVREERETKTLDEVEETNKHAFQNTEGEPKSGIYRWVSKFYRAKKVNYGKRLWYEFIVGQPAAFYIYAQRAHIEHHVMPEEPQEPRNPDDKKKRLKPEHIKRDTYQKLVQKYGADGVKPPPPEFMHIAKSIARSPEENQDFAFVDTDLELPDGYEFVSTAGDLTRYGSADHRLHLGFGAAGYLVEGGKDNRITGNRDARVGLSGSLPYGIPRPWNPDVLLDLEGLLPAFRSRL